MTYYIMSGIPVNMRGPVPTAPTELGYPAKAMRAPASVAVTNTNEFNGSALTVASHFNTLLGKTEILQLVNHDNVYYMSNGVFLSDI